MRAVLLTAKGKTAGEELGETMATVDITDVRPNGNSFAEGRLNPPAELWPPLWPQMERRLLGMFFCAKTPFAL